MSFNDLIRSSGKGLDKSRELVCALEVNLGGTLGTQYFADKGMTVQGTHYDGRLVDIGSIERRIFPDIGSFEISDFSLSLANTDSEFFKAKYVRHTHGQPAKFKIAFHGTRDVQNADWKTRYDGVIEEMEYDYADNLWKLRLEDRAQKTLKTLIPKTLVEDGDFPNADYDSIRIGSPVQQTWGRWSETVSIPSYYSAVSGQVIGKYTEGTSKVLLAGHAIQWSSNPYDDGQIIPAGSRTIYRSGTVDTFGEGTVPVAYMDINYDIGTSAIALQVMAKGTYAGGHARRLLLESGLTDSNLDVSSFMDNRQYSHVCMREQRPAKDWLDDLCYQTNSMVYWNSDGTANFKQYEWINGTQDKFGTRELEEEDFLEFRTSKDATYLINRREIIFNYVPHTGLYYYYGRADHPSSQTRTGRTQTQRIEGYWLWGTGAHWDPGWRYFGRFRYPMYKANFTCPISVLPLEVGNYAQITHTQAPNEYGTQGWKKKPVEIVSIAEDYQGKTVECEAWDYYPGIPMYRLTGWFSCAEGAGTALYLEMAGDHGGNYDTNNWDFLSTLSDFSDEMWANQIGRDYVLTLDGTSQFLTNFKDGWALGETQNLAQSNKAGMMGAFIKPDTLDNMCVLSSDKLGTRGWEMGITNAGAIYFSTGTEGAGWKTKESQHGIVDTGTWQAVHVGITHPSQVATHHRIFWYLNGTQNGTASVLTPVQGNPGAMIGVGAANVGTWIDGTTITGCKFFDGQMADIVNYALGTIMPPGKVQRFYDDLRGRYGL